MHPWRLWKWEHSAKPMSASVCCFLKSSHELLTSWFIVCSCQMCSSECHSDICHISENHILGVWGWKWGSIWYLLLFTYTNFSSRETEVGRPSMHWAILPPNGHSSQGWARGGARRPEHNLNLSHGQPKAKYLGHSPPATSQGARQQKVGIGSRSGWNSVLTS